MPSPCLERGDMAIIVLPAIALTTFDKERDEKKAMRLSCVESMRAEKNPKTLAAMAFAGAVLPTSGAICCKRHPTMNVAVQRMLGVLRFTIEASLPANCDVGFVVQVGLFIRDRC